MRLELIEFTRIKGMERRSFDIEKIARPVCVAREFLMFMFLQLFQTITAWWLGLILLPLAIWRLFVIPLQIDLEHLLIAIVVLYALLRLLFSPLLTRTDYCVRPYFSGIVGGKIPTKLYEGDSAQMVLKFPWNKPFNKGERQFFSVEYFFNHHKSDAPSLEIEVQAAGLEVKGEPVQRYSLLSLPVVYTWNIAAKNSGEYEMGIVMRFYGHPGNPPTMTVSTHKIKIAKIDSLTKRQLWLVTGLFGMITAILGVIQTLVSLKVIDIP
jgi:hypothetical protein